MTQVGRAERLVVTQWSGRLALLALTSAVAGGCSKEREAPAPPDARPPVTVSASVVGAGGASAHPGDSLIDPGLAHRDSLGARSGDSGVAPRTGVDTAALPSDTQLMAMTALEDSLRARPDDPQSARLYLRLGRLKKAYARTLTGGRQDPYALAHPSEFWYDEPAGEYYYLGAMFRALLEHFPESAIADSAAWEVGLLPDGHGRCDDSVECGRELQRELSSRTAAFLRRYPNSALAPQALQRLDETFSLMLADPPDSEGFRVGLEAYQALADSLPLPPRARASESIGDLWVRARRYDRARPLYQWLLTTHPPGVDTVAVRRRLQALPRPGARRPT